MRTPRAVLFDLDNTLGLKAEDCWYVGDHPVNDIAGAGRAGMQAVWLEGFHEWPERPPADYHKISSLHGVLGLLESARP